ALGGAAAGFAVDIAMPTRYPRAASTIATSETAGGTKRPNQASSESAPGPAIPTASAAVSITSGYSNPPSVTHTLGQWIFVIAVSIGAAIPTEPNGLRSPRANKSPPPNSAPDPRSAHRRAGRNPAE